MIDDKKQLVISYELKKLPEGKIEKDDFTRKIEQMGGGEVFWLDDKLVANQGNYYLVTEGLSQNSTLSLLFFDEVLKYIEENYNPGEIYLPELECRLYEDGKTDLMTATITMETVCNSVKLDDMPEQKDALSSLFSQLQTMYGMIVMPDDREGNTRMAYKDYILRFDKI